MKIRCMNCMKEYDEQYELCPFCGYDRKSKPKEAYMLCPEMVLRERYVVGTCLGYGGFGTVYRAWDTKLEHMVAVKEYYPTGLVTRVPGEKDVILSSNKPDLYRYGVTRFLEEARNTAKFNKHKNIVHVYDYFEENQTAYFVMEFLDGMSLKEYMEKKGGRLDADEAIRIVISVTEALKAVHAEHIIHRDIAPDNIFMCKDGSVKLTDFGTARFSTMDQKTVELKMGYAPPEQYDKKSRQGPWTDIYALGATMYQMITGQIPVESTERADAIQKKKEADPLKRSREIREDIPEYIDACLTRAMSLEPALRFQSVQEFEDAILEKTRVLSEKEELARRKKRRIVTASVVGAVILCAGGYSYKAYLDRKAAALLNPASITVWIPAGSGEDITSRQEIYTNMLAEFAAEYEQISIEISCIPESEYVSRLEEAYQGGEMPTLYAFCSVAADYEKADLSDVISLLDSGDYYFLNHYSDCYPDKDVIPLGVSVPVQYGNVNVADVGTENDAEKYLSGQNGVYIGGSEQYFTVQQDLPGVYSVEAVETDGTLTASFTDEWCVNGEAGTDEIAAGKRVLYYWLGEQAQDILHVQNEEALPLNKNIFAVYLDVNPEMEFLADAVRGADVARQTDEERAAYYGELFQQVTEGE